MLNIVEATKVVNKFLPGETIDAYVEYKDLYLFRVFVKRPFEDQMDPFFSVNRQTGEFRDFCIITDGDISEILRLFKAKSDKTIKEKK